MQTIELNKVEILTREYTDLNKIYPLGVLESRTYRIERVRLTEAQVRLSQTRDAWNGKSWLSRGLKADFDYITLNKIKEGVMMSDTPMERNSNYDFIKRANGDVLIFGLGLGLIVLPLLNADDVRSITVVEVYQDLIDVIQPILKQYDTHNKLNIVRGNCFEYHEQLEKGKKFDTVYGDIWISICGDNYGEMKDLTRKWKNKINRENPKAFIDHWMKDTVKKMAD